MSSRYKVSDDTTPHFLTFTVVRWVDVFSREAYRQIVLDSLSYCINNKGLRLHGWVIRSNHLHLVASMKHGHGMSGFVRDFKKFTARKIIAAIAANPHESRKDWMLRFFLREGHYNSSNEEYQFWMQDYHPIELNTKEKAIQRMVYLHQNPVRAGLVRDAASYLYSSAADYAEGITGLLPLERLEIMNAQLW